MPQVFLTDQEIEHLTGGLTQPSAQARWLENNGIPHKLNNKGVVVATHWLEHAPFYKQEGKQFVSSGPQIGSFGNA